jgi:transcription elongation GreA/GreB family factor
MKTSKEAVLKGFIEKFKAEHAALIRSAKAAHQAATHEESKAEDRHDTFAIEASYLAAGQAVRVEELDRTIVEFESFLAGTSPHDQIAVGDLVTYECEGATTHAFLAKNGGGTKLTLDGVTVQVISPTSPLGDELMGRKAGEEFELELRGSVRDYRILG